MVAALEPVATGSLIHEMPVSEAIRKAQAGWHLQGTLSPFARDRGRGGRGLAADGSLARQSFIDTGAFDFGQAMRMLANA